MKKEIEGILDKVEKNSIQIEQLISKLADSYCKDVDEIVSNFKEIVMDAKNPPTDEELDDMVMQLPTHLYFMGQAQEIFGIREDISKSAKAEVFNRIHQLTKGTIADKQAAGEAGTLYEDMVWKAYQRACKRIKQKIESAYELLASLKKVVGRRETEMQLTRMKMGGK